MDFIPKIKVQINKLFFVFYFQHYAHYLNRMLDQDSDPTFSEKRNNLCLFAPSEPGGFNGTANLYSSSSSQLNSSLQASKHQKQQSILSDNSGDQFYKLLFSSKQFIASLLQRNEKLELKCLQNSDSEPQKNYEHRKKRVSTLNRKQADQWQQFLYIKENDPSKYQAMLYFMRVFFNVKQKIHQKNNDYYSSKTFSALQNTPDQQLKLAALVAQNILNQVLSLPEFQPATVQNQTDFRLIQFLIIPRFLISKQKIVKFAKDQTIQENFKFLIYTGCLGHYNNQANKKFPQEKYMQKVRELIARKNGRQKYHKLSSINHGSQFVTAHKEVYYKLFKKSLESLRKIDKDLKKNKKKMVKIVEEFDKFSDDEDGEDIKNIHNLNDLLRKRNIRCEQNDVDRFSDLLSPQCKIDIEAVTLTKTDSNYQNIANPQLSSRLKKAQSLPVDRNLNKSKTKRMITLPPIISIPQNESQ